MKILVVVLDNLGDVVMGTSVLRPLREKYPSATIRLWVKNYTAGLLEDQSLLDGLHASDPFWDTSPGQPKGDFSRFKAELKEIRKEKYDVAFILNTEWRRSLACALAGIKNRVGYKKRKSGPFLTHKLKAPSPKVAPMDEHRALVENWCEQKFPDDVWVPRIDLSFKEKRWADTWLEKKAWKKKSIVVIHPFSGDPLKTWPIKNWFDLMKQLSSKNDNFRFALVCSPPEAHHMRDELSSFPEEKRQVISTYGELKGLLAFSSLLIGGDSGPGHVAAAMGKPVLSLFGPTNPDHYAPRGWARRKILQHDPISGIAVSDVAEAATEILLPQFLESSAK